QHVLLNDAGLYSLSYLDRNQTGLASGIAARTFSSRTLTTRFTLCASQDMMTPLNRPWSFHHARQSEGSDNTNDGHLSRRGNCLTSGPAASRGDNPRHRQNIKPPVDRALPLS
ncbi:uncharacterized protein N7515_002134, partial [Penicillium bovifimosum]